jgi:hypothetical protein
MSSDDPHADAFLVAPNPDTSSKLPWLVRLPIDGGLVLKVREPWPSTARVYCHRADAAWPDPIVEVVSVPVRSCQRRGAAIDLVLDRGNRNRSQFVFTRTRGREMIFWQTPATTKASRPGARVPRRRPEGLASGELRIIVDTRERYAWKFADRPVACDREALPVGDYAVVDAAYDVVATVERKSVDDLASSLSDGSLAFAVAALAALTGPAVVVVEGRYGDLAKRPHVSAGYLVELLARIQARTPDVPIVFCDSRPLAQEYAYRFLASAYVEHGRLPTLPVE